MLRRILLIAKRDYIASVFTKAFLIGLVLTPLLMGGGFFGFALLRVGEGTEERRIAVVDRTGGASGAAIIEVSEEMNRTDPAIAAASKLVNTHFVFEAVAPDTADPDGQRLLLSDRVRSGKLAMFIDIGAAAVHPGTDPKAAKVLVYSTGGGIDDTRNWVTIAVNTGIRRIRLQEIGIDAARAQEVLGNVDIERMGLATRDVKDGSAQAARPRNEVEGIALPVVLVILMMMIVMGGAGPMLSVVAEDKMQRVFEMLLVSVAPFEILAGKILASVGRSLTSSVFYLVGGVLGLMGASLFGLVPFNLLPWFLVYMIAEVTMLSALAAALGSAANNSRDAQQFSIILILPVMLPAFMLVNLLQRPNGALATVLSFIPPLTPMVMLMRQALPGGVPAWQPWVGLLGVLLCTLFMTWAASRVFRIAILTQGKTPRLSELVRWAIRG